MTVAPTRPPRASATDAADGGRTSRSAVLRKAFVATGAVAVGAGLLGALDNAAAARPSRAQDVRILNFLVLIEYLQHAFYGEATAARAISGELRRFAEIAGDHERQHVEALRALLGANAPAKPTFRFGDAIESNGKFTAAALTLEETIAGAYIGQAANLTAEPMLSVARIVAVEARHAAWIRAVAGRLPAPYAADPAKTPVQVRKTLEKTGFVR
jgi:hypothetical protein